MTYKKCLQPFILATLSLLALLSICDSKSIAENNMDADPEETMKDQLAIDSSSDKALSGNLKTDRTLTDSDDIDKSVRTNDFTGWNKRDWKAFATWGKRNSFGTDNSQDTPAQSSRQKRDWSSFNSWGKRDIDDPDVYKRKWEGFSTWGKRDDGEMYDQLTDDKRDWSGFPTWGKRDQDMDMEADKRKWNQFATWGKREYNDDVLEALPEADKRKWNQFATWGKRDIDDEFSPAEKRKWKQFGTWGKRSMVDTDNVAEKRQWKQFATWGKRDVGNSDFSDVTADKRAEWSRFATWGKRLRNARKWAKFNSWGKRKWRGLPTWGKRSADIDDHMIDVMVQSLLRLFDANGDEVLDKSELGTYFRTLMSYQSKMELDTGEQKSE